jgi:hypothetical protein
MCDFFKASWSRKLWLPDTTYVFTVSYVFSAFRSWLS